MEEGLASVESLEGRELVEVLLNEVGELAQEASAFVAGGLQAPGGLERVLGCLDCSVDILGPSSRDLGHDFTNDGVVNTAGGSAGGYIRAYEGGHPLKSSSVNGVHELAVDEQASVHLGGALVSGSIELVGEGSRHGRSEASKGGGDKRYEDSSLNTSLRCQVKTGQDPMQMTSAPELGLFVQGLA